MKKIINSGFTILLALFASCFSGTSKIKKAKQIYVGMNAEEVKKILGEPIEERNGYIDTSELMFIYETGYAASSDIEIYFERGTGKVIRVVLPKGEN